MATVMERGPKGVLEGYELVQGFGLGDDEFSPINVPTLKHLWTNLRPQKETDDVDGYTLRLSCQWKAPETEESKHIEFGLALANDRLFIKTISSDLKLGDSVPTMAYLPPFAGITSREGRINGATRRRRIGEGLAGAILRNLLLDMYQSYVVERNRLQGNKSKISDSDLAVLRRTAPWELLLQTVRSVFGVDIIIREFQEEYHSRIRVDIVRGTADGYHFKRFPDYNARDLMVEGSGFLQWLSVYTLVTTPSLDVLLFDEPDAHLHPTLQRELVNKLDELARATGKQVLLATHSSELLRSVDPERILHARDGRVKYLSSETQKVGLLEGIGSNYSPKFNKIQMGRRVFFMEGTSDALILRILADKLGFEWDPSWTDWITPTGHKHRKHIWQALNDEFGEVVALSLRDRDDSALGDVVERLEDMSYPSSGGFRAILWRRRYIESYLLWPPALADVSGYSEVEVRSILMSNHGLAVGEDFAVSKAPTGLLDARAKLILKELQLDAKDLAKNIPPEAICEDVRTVLEILRDMT